MKGVYTALVTPFDSKGELDLKGFQSVIADQIAAKVAGVIPCGTTGETSTLRESERKKLIALTLDLCKGTPLKVIAGTGSNDTRETAELSKWASDQGVHGVLIVTPYYNKPSQRGLLEHFTAVADQVSCEVVPYNVPGRAAVSLAPETVTALAEHPRITTLKEASGNVALASEFLDHLKKSKRRMDILSGDDATYLAALSAGAVGVISVASNLFPRAMVSLQNAFDRGENSKALEIHQKYYPLFRDLFLESNPVPIKYAMSVAGFCGPTVRRPLVEISPENREKLAQSLNQCKIQGGSRA